MLHIGKNRQLFFDNRIIERVQDITRRYHTPKAEKEPLIKADRPHEKITYFAAGNYHVIKDSEGKWRCWYGIWDFDPKMFTRTRDWYDLEVSFLRLCYAESDDGVNWIKPELDLNMANGRKTNIILGDENIGSFYITQPMEDIYETDPSKRFKTIGVRCSREVYRIEALYSADGIRWSFYETPPSFGTWGPYLNDEIMLSYDPLGRMYTATVRSPYQAQCPLTAGSPVNENSFVSPSEPGAWWRGNKRRVFQTESSDLLHWTQPYPILEPDEHDNLDESFYAMCQTKIGDTYIGFVNLFRECENTMGVRLAYSYDGKAWEWPNNRNLWLEPGKMSGNEWDSIMVYLGVPPIVAGDEHWIYYAGSRNHHDWYITGDMEGLDHPEAKSMSGIGYYLGLARIRLDGFVSLDSSPLRDGIIVTRPFFPEGNRIVINAVTEKDGFIEIEVTDADGNVIPGYGRTDNDRFTGDSVSHVVSWKGNSSAEFSGYHKINFYMRKANLYSFQSTDDPGARSSVDSDLGRKLSVRKWE